MSVTDFAAWWGAVVATGVLVWDIIKWRLAGPRLRLTVRSGMETINAPAAYAGDKTFITIDVINYGDRPTTLSLFCFFFYQNLFNRLRNRPDKRMFVPVANAAYPLPHELKPGGVFTAIVDQTVELGRMARDGCLTCVVYHTHKTRPAKKRVIIEQPQN